MRLLWCILLQVTAPLVIGQVVPQAGPTSRADQPEAIVRSLYKQVVAHHPLGIPEGEEMKIFAPYLSKTLLHRMDLAIGCSADWRRQYPEPDLKPELGWLELGPFSGENERASPQTFTIENTLSDKDGSVHVYVRLARTYPEGRPSIWHVVAVVVQEKDRFVVDDVIYLKDEDYDESRLSDGISAGCEGSRWVGFGTQQSEGKK